MVIAHFPLVYAYLVGAVLVAWIKPVVQAQTCTTQQAAYDNCVNFETEAQADACETCLSIALATNDATVCNDFSQLLCPLLNDPTVGCPCRGCQYAAEEWLECLFGGSCPFGCGFTAANDDPLNTPPVPGVFIQEFWTRFFRLAWNTNTACDYGPQFLDLSCDNPSSSIVFVEADLASITCQNTAVNTMTCADSNADVNFAGTNWRNTGYVRYECRGPELSGTTSLARAADESCTVVPGSGVLGTHIRLATVCNKGFSSSDYFLQCTGQDQQGTYNNPPISSVFGCVVDTALPTSSGVQTVSFGPLEVSTRSNIVGYAQANGCFRFEPSIETTPPPSFTPLEECELEEEAFFECFALQCSDANACEQCMIDALDSFTASGCTDFSDRMCPAIQNQCPCSGCEKISERWLQCLFVDGGCPFLCSFDPDPVLDSPICESTDPTDSPANGPTDPSVATTLPTAGPTVIPTAQPTATPASQPSNLPTTGSPTTGPTTGPTFQPTSQPTDVPTDSPIIEPTAVTELVSLTPTDDPVTDSTATPSVEPTAIGSDATRDVDLPSSVGKIFSFHMMMMTVMATLIASLAVSFI